VGLMVCNCGERADGERVLKPLRAQNELDDRVDDARPTGVQLSISICFGQHFSIYGH
jgi:hypothetical protein